MFNNFLLLPLTQGVTFIFPSPYNVPRLVEIIAVVQQKEIKKCKKSTNGQLGTPALEKKRSEKLTWAFSSDELKTKKNNIIWFKNLFILFVNYNTSEEAKYVWYIILTDPW